MSRHPAAGLLLVLSVASLGVVALGLCVGSTGWHAPWSAWREVGATNPIVWEIRAPRTLGAWLVGALLGWGGALAQGLFRNPLAEPYLLGSSSGAALAVACWVVLGGAALESAGPALRSGLTAMAFMGALAGVLLTLALSRGAAHTLRLLLAGVVVGVVLGAITTMVIVSVPHVWRTMQAFMLGNTALLSWSACGVMGAVLVLLLPLGASLSRVLDALTLGEDTARSLGVPLGAVRAVLVALLALATATAVAQAGLVAFVGLAAPHLVRRQGVLRHGPLLVASALTGGVLLAGADVLSRWVMAPLEMPVGVLTAVLGGGYLIWLMHRRSV